MARQNVRRWMAALLTGMGIFWAVPEAQAKETGRTAVQAGEILSDAGSERLESVYTNLPEVYLYGEFGGRDGDMLEGYLGDQRLDFVSGQQFSETGEPVYYYLLLDVSGSVPQGYVSDLKQGILAVQDSLRSQDRLILCSFGEEVRLLCGGSQTREELEAVLDGLEYRDQKTLLFEAIDQAAGLADQVKADECRRRVMVVFSDGEDIAVGKKQAQEALDGLNGKGIPLYAMCIEDTERENINRFGEFARATGGELILLEPGSAAEKTAALTERVLNSWELEFRAPGNQVTNQKTAATLRMADSGRVLSREVMDTRWIPDTEAPRITGAAAVGGRQIRLTFSEPVLGAENFSSYRVTADGRPVEVSGIVTEAGEAPSVILTLAEDLKDGEYTVSCVNVTDNSMEKNPVANKAAFTASAEKKPEDSSGVYGALAALAAAVVIAAVVIAAVSAGRRKAEPEKEAAPAPEPEEELPDIRIDAEISVNGEKTAHTEWRIEKELIAGRTEDCGILLSDDMVSRRHFALIRSGEELYIMDLNSTNGTLLNGQAVPSDRRIPVKQGDRIEAGPFSVRVTW